MTAALSGVARAARRRDRPASTAGSAFLLVLLCFFLSGVAALLYETAWVRQFSIVFGTAELAIASVLAAYMAGLAIGAGLAARYVRRINRPIVAYALLEAGIALGALAVPWGLSAAGWLQQSFFGGQPLPPDAEQSGATLFHLLCALAVLIVPTSLMGATLPLLARHAVATREQIGPRIGALYAANTAGAIGGAVLTAFVLLPELGLRLTVFVGVGLNVLVFLLAAALSRRESALPIPRRPAPRPNGASAGQASAALAMNDPDGDDAWFDRWAGLVLPLVFVAGMVSFTYEILWTRLVGHLLGGSLQAFATMLASFLAGIALGSAVAAGLAKTRRGAAVGLVWTQFGAAGLSIGVYYLLDRLPELAARLATSLGGGRTADAVVAGLVMLPAALCLGAVFPLAVRVLAHDSLQASIAAARVLAWNTTGAIAGAILAGFVIIPGLGFDGTARLAVLLNLTLGLIACFFLARPRLACKLATAGCAMVVAVAFQPSQPRGLMLASRYAGLSSEGEIVFSEVGPSSTVLMLEQDGRYFLRNNGLPEAAINARGEPPGRTWIQGTLTALPLLARPEMESMLFIGLGGGVAVEGVPEHVREIDVIELEPAVLAANRAIAGERELDPLADPRVRVILNDARGALRLTDRRYDAIVSQPSHPWIAGASHLYTREFMIEARDHLTPGGVFVAWMDAALMDVELLRSLAATLTDVFPRVRLYRPRDTYLLFIASDGPLEIERDLVAGEQQFRDTPLFQRLGLLTLEDVAGWLLLDEVGVRWLGGDALPNTDDDNRLAMRPPPSVVDRGQRDAIEALITPLDACLAPSGALHAHPPRRLDWDYLVRHMANRGAGERAAQIAQRLPESIERRLALAHVARSFGNEEEANRQLLAVLAIDPQQQRALFARVEPWLPALARDEAPSEIAAARDRLTGTVADVALAWRHVADGEFARVEALEPRLASCQITDPWYPHAQRLRAAWRLHAPGPPEERVARGRKALALIDRSLVVEPNRLDALSERMNAALVVDRPDIWLATANRLAGCLQIESVAPHPRGDDDRLRRIRAESMRGLDLLAASGRVPSARLAKVRARFESAPEAGP